MSNELDRGVFDPSYVGLLRDGVQDVFPVDSVLVVEMPDGDVGDPELNGFVKMGDDFWYALSAGVSVPWASIVAVLRVALFARVSVGSELLFTRERPVFDDFDDDDADVDVEGGEE